MASIRILKHHGQQGTTRSKSSAFLGGLTPIECFFVVRASKVTSIMQHIVGCGGHFVRRQYGAGSCTNFRRGMRTESRCRHQNRPEVQVRSYSRLRKPPIESKQHVDTEEHGEDGEVMSDWYVAADKRPQEDGMTVELDRR
jgi:hypothetical protein